MRTFVTAEGLFGDWLDDLHSTEPPLTWSSGDECFDHVELAPGRIVLVGGGPGAGKTAAILQWVFGMLETNPDLRVLVANVEMSPMTLMTRQLSRLSGIPLTAIRKRQVDPADRRKLDEAASRIGAAGDRLAFGSDPHRLDAIATAASDHGADLVVLDYLQRIAPASKADGMRDRINALMSEMRRLANVGGIAILAAAALARGGQAKYEGKGMGLGSFRESSELEYGADDALLLYPSEDDDPSSLVRSMTLHHAKCRDGEQRDVSLEFHRRTQRFKLNPWSPSTDWTMTVASNGKGKKR
ncbi:DnaB-like helicase C-terminal domain-containing protein [Tautonia rosea]|uniref:DnaB-like helicase C-terminal domain-containing protein n=1 Tax=Tautonia rosea TaxID=2728037 RepID=UPI001474DD1A|nr:DnaB-like helicase C-terminal domain-containing protein [Tautonia rosea]